MATIDFLLRKADDHVAEIRAHYEADLAAKEVSDELLYAVRNTVSNCLSALDWTANAVKEKYGPNKGRSPYFPLRPTQQEFEDGIDQQIKGLRAKEPAVAAAFERHQPYQAGKSDLGHLHALGRVEKHQDFTPQTRQEQRTTRVETSGGGSVEYTDGVTFSGNVSIGGVPVDPSTQMPVPHPSQRVTVTTYVDWRFKGPSVSVLPTLENLVRLVREAVADVRSEANL